MPAMVGSEPGARNSSLLSHMGVRNPMTGTVTAASQSVPEARIRNCRQDLNLASPV